MLVYNTGRSVYIRKISHVTGPNRRSLLGGSNGPPRARVGPVRRNAGP